ncbi:PP2C family protein-serine/threonine phosphatase [Actinomadura xylanilytica]|uniref:PP2C family protein-serine/threonine phosphatase n=1 Tax=Actinomadura xylanilytica TaxID=887459 RepID=UPI0032E44645
MTKPAELSCPICTEVVYAGEDFCEACGHRLNEDAPSPPPEGFSPPPREGLTMKTTPSARTAGHEAASSRACTGCGQKAIDADGYCEHCGLRQPAERDHIEIELPGPGTGPGGDGAAKAPAAAGASDRGKRYSRNEDAIALAVHAQGVAAVVCDGVGSSPHPDDASRAAADTGVAELVALLEAGEDPESATRAAALRAAEAVAALAPSPSESPSCTYVSAVTGPGSVTVGWIGDSRAYWLSPSPDGGAATEAGTESGGGGEGDDGPDTAEFALSEDTEDVTELGPPRQLTDDDSWAAIMVAQGALTEAEAEAHPNAHVITAWLGADADEIRPHVRTFTPGGPGTLLVCSDGLWNYFPAAEDLAALLTGPAGDPAGDPLGTARTLVQHALNAGGRDNVTVAVIPFPGAAPLPTPSTEHDR